MSELPLLDDADVWRVEQDDVQRGNIAVAVGVEELEEYCHDGQLSLGGMRERIAGIPPYAVQESNFFCLACSNEGVTLEIAQCILNTFPGAARTADSDGCSPLHYACYNTLMVPGTVQLLLESWPESVNLQDDIMGDLPLHRICANEDFDEADALAILDLLLNAAPLSATLEGRHGCLPIHLACVSGKPVQFCKRLIDADPKSLRARDSGGYLPIHRACFGGHGFGGFGGHAETVKYILELDPESVDARDGHGALPIHCAAQSYGPDKAGIIKYLLAKDPDCASKRNSRQNLPLHLAVHRNCLDSVHLLFDACPEVITIRDGDGAIPLDLARGSEVPEFLQTQLVYARKAEDMRAMTTPDVNGWLPLHLALWNGVCLGAIKLLVAGNRDALQMSDNQSAFPLHIACEHSSVGVVEYLLGLPDNHLHSLDLERDSTLHYACRSGNLGVVKCLLERGVPAVSEPNSDGKLPIHLLWENDRVDRISLEYVEAVWLLLLARPETVSH